MQDKRGALFNNFMIKKFLQICVYKFDTMETLDCVSCI